MTIYSNSIQNFVKSSSLCTLKDRSYPRNSLTRCRWIFKPFDRSVSFKTHAILMCRFEALFKINLYLLFFVIGKKKFSGSQIMFLLLIQEGYHYWILTITASQLHLLRSIRSVPPLPWEPTALLVLTDILFSSYLATISASS